MSEKNSLEKSVGMRNFYTLWCEKFEQRRDYGACIWQIEAYRREGKPEKSEYATCQSAMCGGSCVAIKMREEEEAKGEAIYFREQNLVNKHEGAVKAIDKKSDSYKRGWNQVGGKREGDFKVNAPKRSKSQVTKKKVIEVSDSGGFAEALTKAVKDESEKVTLAQLLEMKKRVVSLSKTNMNEAKALFKRVKFIEENKLVTA